MHCFSYRGKNFEGELVTGEMWGESEQEILSKLRYQNILLIHMERKNKRNWFKRKNTWSFKEVANFSFQMNQLLISGLSLGRIFELLGHQSKKKKLYEEMNMRIHYGENLSTVLREVGFPLIGSTLVQAGEESGLLGETFLDIHRYYERLAKWRSKLWQALTYPLMVLALIIIFFFGAVLFILPTFQEVFDTLGVALPNLTLTLLEISRLMREKTLVILLLIVVFGSFILVLFKTKKSRFYIDQAIWKISHQKVWYGYYFYARVSRVLGMLLKSGTPLMEALPLVEPLWGNLYAISLQKEVTKKISEGNSLSGSFSNVHLGTAYLVDMIYFGELSGNIDEVFLQCALYYDGQVEAYMNGIQQVLEPLLISFVGVCVGVLVLAIMLPIFETISAVTVM